MNARAAAVETLKVRLGHAFADESLLERALTHASVAGAHAKVRTNEVLEFIGDRVLGLLAAERLAALDPNADEGALALRFNALVDREACVRAAENMGLGPAIRLAPGPSNSTERARGSILADACEAVMAAVYLDGGLDAARRIFLEFWSDQLANPRTRSRDPKTELQEWAQSRGKPVPTYAVKDRKGPDHEPVFTVELAVAGLSPVSAQGRSRQEAEKAAAAALLAREVGA
jgi:ribonuclease-3